MTDTGKNQRFVGLILLYFLWGVCVYVDRSLMPDFVTGIQLSIATLMGWHGLQSGLNIPKSDSKGNQ